MTGWGNLNLLRELVLKDLKIRYSRPRLGFLWAFLSPFFIVIIFYIVFGLFLKIRIEEAPFVLYLMTGVFPWIFFQESALKSTTSLMDNKNLIRESGFPHYLVPVSIVLANFINFLASLLIMIICSLFILKGLPVLILLLPLVVIMHLFMITGLSMVFSILYVKWRDIKYILDASLLLLFYLTPVFYSIFAVKTALSPLLFRLYLYNPFVGMLNLYRIAVLKEEYPVIQDATGLISLIVIPLIFSILILSAGFYMYGKNRNTINDHLAY